MHHYRKFFLLAVLFTLCITSSVWGQTQEVTSGTLNIGNGFYEIFVEASTGRYTARTGANHPTGAGLSVLYDGDAGSPGTSFHTIRSYTSMTDYVQRDTTPPAGFQSVNLSSFTPRSQIIDGNGIRTRYLLDPAAEGSTARDNMEIIQDIRVIGTNERNSAVQVTTRITNLGANNLQVGVRYLWDFEIGQDDGPAFATRSPESGEINTEVEYLTPQFSYFQMQDNDRNTASPILAVLGTVNIPSSFNPPATTPSLLRNACWRNAADASFEYTIDAQRDINTPASNCRGDAGGDGAVLYYFGHDQQSAYTLSTSQIQTISAYIFLNPPAPADDTDTDGDGLLDTWEINGVDYDRDGTVDVDLRALGLNHLRKDVLVYYDWTAYTNPDESNQPRAESLALVTAAFANAPVRNPDGTTGITLHFRAGKAVSDGADRVLGSWDGSFYSWQEFADIKASSFPAELWPFYHYVIFANKHAPNNSSGQSRNSADFGAGASDFHVTLGSWGRNRADWVQIEAGTIMHELGHNLGLGHGGINIQVNPDGTLTVTPNHDNQKPNHLSIMSYSFQTQGLSTSGGRIIDYSRFNADDLPALHEVALSETTWVGASTTVDNATSLVNASLTGYSTLYYCPNNTTRTVLVAAPVDWNCDGRTATELVTANIDGTNNQSFGTANEWEHLVYDGGALGSLGAALDLPLVTDTRLLPEPSRQQHEALLNNTYIPYPTALIVNGSFEEPADATVNGLQLVTDNTFLPGWVLVDGDVEIATAAAWEPAAGQRSLSLNGSRPSVIQQSVPTVVGQEYALRHAFRADVTGGPAAQSMAIGITRYPDIPLTAQAGADWINPITRFVALEPVTVITFRSTTEGAYGPLLDQVSLVRVCTTDVTLANELSDAIRAANAGTGCDTIRLNADISLGQLLPPYPGEMGDNAFPIITAPIAIEGNGHVISRVNAVSDFRFFEVNGRNGNQGNLTLRNLTLAGSNLPLAGAVLVDGSRGGYAAITVENVTFADNTSAGNGGALTALSSGGRVKVVINDSVFRNNAAVFGGAVYIGGFDNGNAVTQISNSSFIGNRSTDGGAVYNNGLGAGGSAVMTVGGSLFENNVATASGGAIFTNGSFTGNARLTITTSRFVNNTGVLGSAVFSTGRDEGSSEVGWDTQGEISNDNLCLSGDASGALQEDATCG